LQRHIRETLDTIYKGQGEENEPTLRISCYALLSLFVVPIVIPVVSCGRKAHSPRPERIVLSRPWRRRSRFGYAFLDALGRSHQHQESKRRFVHCGNAGSRIYRGRTALTPRRQDSRDIDRIDGRERPDSAAVARLRRHQTPKRMAASCSDGYRRPDYIRSCGLHRDGEIEAIPRAGQEA